MKRSRVCNTAQVKTSCHTSVSNDVETLVKKPLHICKKVDKEEACQGETLTYTIKIKNSIFPNSLIFQGLSPIKYQNLMYFPLFLPL